MKGRKEPPAGTVFLRGAAGRGGIFKICKSEKDAKAAIRLLACRMKRRGMSVYGIAGKPGRPSGASPANLMSVAVLGVVRIKLGVPLLDGPSYRLYGFGIKLIRLYA